MHFSACGHMDRENELIWAVQCLAGYLFIVLGKGMCAYVGSVIYNKWFFVLLWAAVTPLCLVVRTNMWLGDQMHSTACCNGRLEWLSSEAWLLWFFCFLLLQLIQYCFGYTVKNSIKTISPKNHTGVYRNCSVNSDSLLCVLPTPAAPRPHLSLGGSWARSSAGELAWGSLSVGMLLGLPAITKPVAE